MRIDHKLYHKLLRRVRAVAVLVVLLVCLTASILLAAGPAQGVDIDALIAAMTLEEKVSMLHGTGFGATPERCLGSAGYVAGVERLGIPGLCMADGPAGIRVSEPATAMPAPVALASTFDPDLAYSFGQVIGSEGRAYGQDVLLAPMVNLVRVPQAGRNFETLGEDPLLANRIVAQEVGGVQDAGLIATIKHYVCNNQEENRQRVNVNIDEQPLHEIYLPGFEGAITGGTGAVMCAYNKVNGAYSCENSVLLNDILRDQWGFTGWVLTDWMAAHPSGVNALPAGLDQEMPREDSFGSDLIEAVNDDPDTWEPLVDQAVRRILVQMDRVGLLNESPPPRPDIDDIKDADAAVAKDVAIAGAVLMRNEKNTLPLKNDDLRSLVVMGPTAVTPLIGGGGSARVIPFYRKSPLDALIEQAGSKADISYVKGIDLDGVVVPEDVLQTPDGESGLLRTNPDGSTQIDPQVEYTGENALPSTDQRDGYVWIGTLTVPSEGDYELKVHNSAGEGSLWLDGDRILSIGGFFGGGSLIPTADGLTNNSATVHLTAGAHDIELRIGAGGWRPPYPPTGPIELRLAWVTPEWRQAKIDEAVEAASSARAVVVFAYVEGTEFEDRASLSLPGNQDELIEAVASANRRTVIVLNVGAPVLMPWVEQTGAVLNTWYPGQEGADATAALLLGHANPGGKLPVTFPRSEADTPIANDPYRYPGVDDEQYYSEGIFVGYRWYDAEGIEPLFPFGHGLSYTQFKYSKLNIQPSGDGYDVSFLVRNVGPMQGAEVPQVYLGPPSAPPAAMAQKKLVGFERIELAPGHAQEVTVYVGARELSYWSESDDAWVVATGSRPVYVGSSSRDIRLEGTIE